MANVLTGLFLTVFQLAWMCGTHYFLTFIGADSNAAVVVSVVLTLGFVNYNIARNVTTKNK